MVYRVYVEKKAGFDHEAQSLLNEVRSLLGIESVTGLRLLNRYDVEGISRELFDSCVPTVFSEPPVDTVYDSLPAADATFAVEYLPGQFDQRASSASECIQLISQGERPQVRTARVYLLTGHIPAEDMERIKKYVINPVEAREASLETVDTLQVDYPVPADVEVLKGFLELDEQGLKDFIAQRGLAMDEADIAFCQQYFRYEHREPTITEIKMIDTYWSDHCRHTTFGTILEEVRIEDVQVKKAFDSYLAMRKAVYAGRKKDMCLMDLATIGGKYLKAIGKLKDLDESDEINACTVKIKCDVDGEEQDWLYLFIQERDPQPPHRDRALRRRGHLHRRRHPRPPVRPQLRLSGHARHRRGRPAGARGGHPARQTAPAQAGHHRRGGLFQLRQPDRPCHRPGDRAVSPRLCGQAHGDRRGGGRGPCRQRPA